MATAIRNTRAEVKAIAARMRALCSALRGYSKDSQNVSCAIIEKWAREIEAAIEKDEDA